MRYFIGQNGQRLGPFDAPQLRDKLAAGAISPDDLIWHEGMAGWQPVRSVLPTTDLPPPLPTAPAWTQPGAGGPAHHADIARAIREEGPALASRGRRLAATSIDHLLVFICLLPGLVKFFPLFVDLVLHLANTGAEPTEEMVQGMIAQSFTLFTLLPLFVLGFVQMLLLCTRAQTVGKIFCKIRVVRANGDRAGFVHAFLLRVVVMGLLTGIPVVGGFIALADPCLIFREDRRYIHDLLAGTTVIDV